MPVYKEENGTYSVRYYSKDPVTQESKQIRKRGFRTRREATAWEAESRTERKTTRSSATFWEIFQRQLDNNDTSLTTRDKKEKWVNMYFSEYTDTPIEKITKAQLVDWRNNLKNTGLAVRTLNCGLQYVRSVFAFYSTVYGGLNAGSALKNFKLTKADKAEMQIWTPEEFNLFAEAVENPVVRAYFTFLFWTGCRRGEGLALTADCFQGNRCHIYRSVKHFKNGLRPLKTDSSERTITIDRNTMEIIQPLVEDADPFVFGKVAPIGSTTVDREFRRAIKASGVKQIRIHDLRHSHASFLLNNGANILAVSKRLGHATVTQTLETYAHLMQDTEDQMIGIIEGITGSTTSPKM